MLSLKFVRLGMLNSSAIGIRIVKEFPESGLTYMNQWVDAVLDRMFATNLRFAREVLELGEKSVLEDCSGREKKENVTPNRGSSYDNGFPKYIGDIPN